MAGFERTLEELFNQADPQSLLDVGCGEAVLTHKWAQRLAPRRVVGIDLEDPAIQAEWEKRQAPNLEYRDHEGRADAVRRPRVRRRDRDRGARARARPGAHGGRDGARGRALAARLACRASRCGARLNMARGAYVKDLGNTPGHVNHWSKRSFVSLLARHGEVVEARSPFPWTMLLVRL